MPSTVSASPTSATDFAAPLLGGRTHFLLRRLHSLTGILFGGYIIIHLLVNATLIEGDIGDEALIDRVMDAHDFDAIIHFAGSVVVPDLLETIYSVAAGSPSAARSRIARGSVESRTFRSG